MNLRDLKTEGRLWERTLGRLRAELADLPAAERRWLAGQVAAVGRNQERLHDLFLATGGSGLCASCEGDCCGCGRNHLTLANLLPFLLADEDPPVPDFSAPCPWLGPAGCRFAAARRPFNCVTFLCPAVEGRLSPVARREFYRLEEELRTSYLVLARRFAGAGRQGLLLRAERLAGRGFFNRP